MPFSALPRALAGCIGRGACSSSNAALLLDRLAPSSHPELINSARLLDRVWPIVPPSSSSSSSSDLNSQFLKRGGPSQRLFVLHHQPHAALALLQVHLSTYRPPPPPPHVSLVLLLQVALRSPYLLPIALLVSAAASQFISSYPFLRTPTSTQRARSYFCVLTRSRRYRSCE
jgi:hypothetical protein